MASVNIAGGCVSGCATFVTGWKPHRNGSVIVWARAIFGFESVCAKNAGAAGGKIRKTGCDTGRPPSAIKTSIERRRAPLAGHREGTPMSEPAKVFAGRQTPGQIARRVV